MHGAQVEVSWVGPDKEVILFPSGGWTGGQAEPNDKRSEQTLKKLLRMRTEIRDKFLHLLARIEETSGGEILYDGRTGTPLGRYEKGINVTRNNRGDLIGPGNQLQRLIPPKWMG